MTGSFGVLSDHPANNSIAIKEMLEIRDSGYEVKLNFCNFGQIGS